MKKLKEELNSIVEWIDKEEENKKMEEIHMSNVEINNSWIDEKEIEHETTEERMLKVMHRTINEVINLMTERTQLYEVRTLYELQKITKKIEELKKRLELILIYETRTLKEKNIQNITELIVIINWIEDEQEKFKL